MVGVPVGLIGLVVLALLFVVIIYFAAKPFFSNNDKNGE